MKRITFAFLAAAVLLTGCWQKSLHPFYTAGDLAPDPQLIGRWETIPATPEADPERWRFTQDSPKSFAVEFMDTDGKKYKYVAHLFHFEGKRLFDFVPAEPGASTIAAHHLLHVSELGSVLKMAPLRADWMRDFLTANPHALAHMRVAHGGHDEVILLAETAALQNFLRQHLDEPGLFDDPIILHKVSPALMNEITRILQTDAGAPEKLLPLVYEELRKLARAKMANELPGQTLQPTALVHEAYLRLVGNSEQAWANRAHFFAAAAEAMRRILIDRARHRNAARHGGGQRHVRLDGFEIAAPADDPELLAIHEALEKFAATEPLKAEIVKLKYFAGLSTDEAAAILGISAPTAKRHWAYARAWLFRELQRDKSSTSP